MTEVHPQRRGAAIVRIQQGIRACENTSETAVTIAGQLASIKPISDENIRFSEGEESWPEDFDPAVDYLRRARNVAEVLEDELHVDVGHGKFARAATAASNLSSIGSISIAANKWVLRR